MQFKPVEPAYGSLAPFGDLLEHFMAVDTAIVTYHDGGSVDKGQPCGSAFAVLEVDTQRDKDRGHQRHKAGITEQVGEAVSEVAAHIEQVVGLEVTVVGLMEMRH